MLSYFWNKKLITLQFRIISGLVGNSSVACFFCDKVVIKYKMKYNVSPSLLRQYAIVTIANFGAITTGLSLVWSSPAIVKLRNGSDIPLSRPITDEESSWIVSGGYLISIGTNILGGMLMDKIGRKKCIFLVSFLKLFMSIWTIFVTEVWMLILCRVVMVASDCFVLVVVPVYVSEIACIEHRGSLVSFTQLFTCIGIVITFSIGPFLTYTALNIFISIMSAATLLPLFFIPDSPYYKYSKGHTDYATAVLSQIRDSDLIVKEELEVYKSCKENNINRMALCKSKTFFKSLLLGILLCAGSNFTGYNAVSAYLQTILQSTRTNVRPEVASVIIGCIQLFASFCTSMITNRLNRRTILVYSLIGIILGLLGLGTFFNISKADDYIIIGFMNYLPIISLILVIFCYNIGIGTLLWLITAELFDGTSRAFGFSGSFISGSISTFLVSKYFTLMTTTMGPDGVYWFYSATCLIVLSLIVLFLPETKGKTFNEIQVALCKKNIQF